MSEKVLSIVIPMYQAEAYIEKCLDSLVIDAAHRELLDILVIDDGSKDQGAERVERYVEKYPQSIRLLRQQNAGHGGAVDAGIAQSVGTYVRVLDADDWLIPKQLVKLLDFLQEMKPVDLVVCDFLLYDIRRKQSERISARTESEISYIDMEELIRRWNALRYDFVLHGMIYRTDFYKKQAERLPRHVYYDDVYYITDAASLAETICIWRQPVYVYRVGDSEQSVSAKNRIRRVRQAETVILALCKTEGKKRTAAGMEYWYRKVVSAAADVFVTCFLRYEKRNDGRKEAAQFRRQLQELSPAVAKRVRKKYWILYGMGCLHMKERQFEALLKIRR